MIADTSVLLRLVADDNPRKTRDVVAFLELPERERGPVVVAPSTISELVYVLQGPRLNVEPDVIAGLVEAILTLPLRFLDYDVIQAVMSLYPLVHQDWDDCLVAAYALIRGDRQILAYDRDFNRIPGLSRIEPPMVNAS